MSTKKIKTTTARLPRKNNDSDSEYILAVNQYRFKKEKDASALLAEQKLKDKQKHDQIRREGNRQRAALMAISQLKRNGIDPDVAKNVVDLITTGKITGVKLFSD